MGDRLLDIADPGSPSDFEHGGFGSRDRRAGGRTDPRQSRGPGKG
jgi:hypothetical protein